MTWHIHVDRDDRYFGDDPDNERWWTITQYPGQPGWNTDSGFPGYGLTKAAAQFLRDAANEKEAREGKEFEDTAPHQSYL